MALSIPFLQKRIRELALEHGIDDCGFTSIVTPLHGDFFKSWIANGHHAGMAWLKRHQHIRLNPQNIMPDAQSIISVVINYQHETPSGDLKIARYAHGRDYHIWLRDQLDGFAQKIRQQLLPDFKWRICVDSAPVLEREIAVQAGLGWQGKNTCLIHPQLGSFVFLAEVFCNHDLGTALQVVDQCGSCQLCIQACPTQALTPYALDANQCLAYHNIEHRGERDAQFANQFGEHTIGCDVCQDVCPWNHHQTQSQQSAWLDDFFVMPDFTECLNYRREDYRKQFRDSAMSRLHYEDFMRNVFLAIAAKGRVDLINEVKQWQVQNPDVDLVEFHRCVSQLGALVNKRVTV